MTTFAEPTIFDILEQAERAGAKPCDCPAPSSSPQAEPVDAPAWRDVPGFEGSYQVSDDGRVRSLDRLIVNRAGVVRLWRGRVHRTPVRGDYPHIHLTDSHGGPGRNAGVHILVAEAFLGPRPAGMQVAHTDGNALNPRLDNLRYATPSENEADKRRHGTNYQLNKTSCPVGHPYTPENTKLERQGRSRKCRECAKARSREYAASGRRRAARKPVDTEAQRIRRWALSQGIAVAATGRLSPALRDAYRLARTP